MERPSWERIQEIYYSTLGVGESERRAFLETACGFDALLIREVNSLLEADESSGNFLEPPLFELGLRIITSKPNQGEGSAAPSLDPLIGFTIDGRYLIERELGRGGMGCVYLARDVSLHNRPIVIKTLLPASFQKDYLVRKFRQEVEALSRIDHPGVVNVLGAGALPDGKLYIGMQYVNGVTLRSQIPDEGMNFERAASILTQVGAALDDVHAKRIFHRDLKPENIMLQTLTGGTELVKIVDFGIAKVKDSVVAPSTINEVPVGTVVYMSPEQLRGEKVTAVSDIFSMALIAYEMLTGRRPFNPTSGPQLLEMQREGVRVGPADLRPNLSTQAQAIILRGLSYEPNDRYQTASDFGDALARAMMEDEVISPDAKEAPSSERAKRIEINATDVAIPTGSDPLSPGVYPQSGAGWASTGRGPRSFWPWIVGVPLFVIVCAAAILGLYKFSGSGSSSNSASGPHRTLTYWLTVQKMRDGQPYEDSFQTSGQEIFEEGYLFRLSISSRQAGFLYVFNEGAPEKDRTNFTFIYPTPLNNQGSARLEQNQNIQTNWNEFAGEKGTERFWIIWSVTAVTQLEIARHEAFKNEQGAITDPKVVENVRNFLRQNSDPKPETTKDTEKQRTNVRASGELLVKLVELEHR
ncbi:MAG TPA: serine/threonine-protein kinase [Pyrinomonadaceae bacterium]|nr:serine/threonine-protein kinase [Pyrinomonadaceae bacterium]